MPTSADGDVCGSSWGAASWKMKFKADFGSDLFGEINPVMEPEVDWTDSEPHGPEYEASVSVSSSSSSGKHQLSSLLLFASSIVLINLCPPFQLDPLDVQPIGPLARPPSGRQNLGYLDASLHFVRLMFKNPMRLDARVTRCTFAEARVPGEAARVWYAERKIKKLARELKKRTLAAPALTPIPIYHPQPQVTRMTRGAGLHHAAASSLSSSAAQISAEQHEMVAAASDMQPSASRLAPQGARYTRQHLRVMYQPRGSAAAQRIINAYRPSWPLFVDDTEGLYGHYGNAYGRYDGGYSMW